MVEKIKTTQKRGQLISVLLPLLRLLLLPSFVQLFGDSCKRDRGREGERGEEDQKKKKDENCNFFGFFYLINSTKQTNLNF